MTIAPSNIFARYQRLQRYLEWTDEDEARIRTAAELVVPNIDQLIDDFYAAIQREPETEKVITGGEQQIERLKSTLRGWLEELMTANYDREYVERRWRVGWRHVDIGLDQVFTNVAIARLRKRIAETLARQWTGDAMSLCMVLTSINQLLDLDLAIIEDAYQALYLARRQQTERLATIGQVAGGIAHELRNPLNVVKTSVYYLLNAKNATPEKTREHLARIERQVGTADGVITALSSFSKVSAPNFKKTVLEDCLGESLKDNALPENVEVSVSLPDTPTEILGDGNQLKIVFGNLIRNARDAMMTGGGRLEMSVVKEEDEVHIAFHDTGEGIPAENLTRVMEPLFTTKTRGIGLGLAVTRAIVDLHGGQLEVSSDVGSGTTFLLRLRRLDPD